LTRQQLLDLGRVEASNLMEALSIDFSTLLCSQFPQMSPIAWDKSITRKMAQAAQAVFEAGQWEAVERMANAPSDTLRGIAALASMNPAGESLDLRLQRIRPFADDGHFAVREWAWMAIRPYLAADLTQAVGLLQPWTQESSPYLRRFAIEATRPRGVWCKHIEELKQDPQRAIALLEPLRADPNRYVQDSVSNWMNDASKTQPQWVEQVCGRWSKESPAEATKRIVKRSLRSIR
jgi:3-methyladenine DNA glycosylase AlkC